VKRHCLLLDPLLPPQNLTLSLPAISPDQAELILQIVDELHDLLWHAYGQAVIDFVAEDQVNDTSDPRDDTPDF
jgi:hypothetical protein